MRDLGCNPATLGWIIRLRWIQTSSQVTVAKSFHCQGTIADGFQEFSILLGPGTQSTVAFAVFANRTTDFGSQLAEWRGRVE